MPLEEQKLSEGIEVLEVGNGHYFPLFIPNVSNNYIKYINFLQQIITAVDAYTKSETDLLLDAKANDDDVIHKTGFEAVLGIKDFHVFPTLPNTDPTEDFEAVHKKYVDVLHNTLLSLINQLTNQVANRWIVPTNLSAAINPGYPAAVPGQTFLITDDGKVGGATNGVMVKKGHIVLCLSVSPGGDQLAVGNNYAIISGNIVPATTTVAGTIKTSTHVSVVAGLATDEAVTPETLNFTIDNLLVRKTALKTQRFYFGVNAAPAGYIQVPLSNILTHANLVGVTIYGMCFMDNSPFDHMLSAPFNSATGTMDLSSFGDFYEGSKLVLTTFK